MKRYAALFALIAAVSGPASAGGNADSGKDIAIKYCARCHVIGAYNKFGGIGSTPSFNLLLGLQDGMERFESFYERRPHPVFVRVPDVPKWGDSPAYASEFTVTRQNLDDILAFVLTLEKKDLKRVPVVGGVGPNARQRIMGATE